ncbi:hypothetical protein HMPREF9946_02172 [Acetobacteraceae bacterium AT-5844]|nr:hypothetical protein HMPREF9946_02172 [Acetobacteraceae bacterium AT-5844]
MRFRNQNANVEAKAKVYYPTVADGWDYWHFTNGSVEKACRNLIKGGTNAAPIGAPTPEANYLRCKGLAGYLQTAYLEQAEFTVYLVGRTTDTLVDNPTRPMFWGTFNGPAASDPSATSPGASLYVPSAGNLTGGAGRNNGTPNGTAASATVSWTPTNWTLFSLRVDNAETILRNESAGTEARFGPSAWPRFITSNMDRIGVSFGSYQGTCDIAMVSRARLKHSEAQRMATLADIRRYMQPRDIAA